MDRGAQPHGFQFPGRFELSAMGAADAGLERRVPEVLTAAGVTVDPDSIRVRPSRHGRYVSVSVSFWAESRDQHSAAYAALRALAEVKWTL